MNLPLIPEITWQRKFRIIRNQVLYMGLAL